MILRQFLHHDPSGISYLFDCGGYASGAVVDPVGNIAPYLRASEETEMRTVPTPTSPGSCSPGTR